MDQTMILTEAQRRALELVARASKLDLYLAGVAVGLRLQHRQSRDLNFFTADADPEALAEAFAQIEDVRIMGRAPGTLYVEIGGVPVSLIRYRYRRLDPLERVEGVAVPLASGRDLVCMKLSAIASRGALRDFWDLHAMLTSEGVGLEQALGWYQEKYGTEDPGHVVRSLAYFEDADAEPFPVGLSRERWARIKSDFRSWVRALR